MRQLLRELSAELPAAGAVFFISTHWVLIEHPNALKAAKRPDAALKGRGAARAALKRFGAPQAPNRRAFNGANADRAAVCGVAGGSQRLHLGAAKRPVLLGGAASQGLHLGTG